MQRHLSDLADRVFDLVVVGGGICGLTIACDAAQRGLSVALVERDDFGSGSSFNHLRTIHGGLRYLQHLDIARARESIAERRTLAIIAPWALRPTPFVLPLDRSLTRGPLAMRAGFLLDRLVARDRNHGVAPSHALPAGEVVSAEQAGTQVPLLAGVPMPAAAIWWDYLTIDADRLTLAWATAAARHGAVLANYVEATSLLVAGGRVVGVSLRDCLTQEAMDLRATTVVNATGGRLDQVLESRGLMTGVPMTKVMNLVTRLDAPAAAVGGRSRSGRNFFLVPWRGHALFGTWESGTVDNPDNFSIRRAEVEAFIDDITHAFPSLPLTPDKVTLVHRGLVPAVTHPGTRVAPDGHERIHDHGTAGHPEVISVAAAKYTTARSVAAQITDRVYAVLGRAPVPCRTATTPLPQVALTGDALLRHAAEHEMVSTLADAVIRRTPLGALGLPDQTALRHAAKVVGEVRGWNETRREDEVRAVTRFYDGLRPVD